MFNKPFSKESIKANKQRESLWVSLSLDKVILKRRDERAHLQLAVDATIQVLQKYTLLSIDTNNGIDEEKEVDVLNDVSILHNRKPIQSGGF